MCWSHCLGAMSITIVKKLQGQGSERGGTANSGPQEATPILEQGEAGL